MTEKTKGDSKMSRLKEILLRIFLYNPYRRACKDYTNWKALEREKEIIEIKKKSIWAFFWMIIFTFYKYIVNWKYEIQYLTNICIQKLKNDKTTVELRLKFNNWLSKFETIGFLKCEAKDKFANEFWSSIECKNRKNTIIDVLDRHQYCKYHKQKRESDYFAYKYIDPRLNTRAAAKLELDLRNEFPKKYRIISDPGNDKRKIILRLIINEEERKELCNLHFLRNNKQYPCKYVPRKTQKCPFKASLNFIFSNVVKTMFDKLFKRQRKCPCKNL